MIPADGTQVVTSSSIRSEVFETPSEILYPHRSTLSVPTSTDTYCV